MPELYNKIAEANNTDIAETMSTEEIYKKYFGEPPKEESAPPQEITTTPEDLTAKAKDPATKSMFERIFATPPEPTNDIGLPPAGAETTAAIGQKLAGGAVLGTVGIAQTLSQLAYDVAYAGDNIAKKWGLTQEEMLQPHKIDWKNKLGVPEDDIATRLIGGTVEYLAPGMVAAKAFKAGMLGAAATNVVLDALAIDPNQERLADLITDHTPELRDWAALGPVLKYLEHNDKDSNWTGRFKNGLESFFVNSVLLGSAALVKKGINAYETSKAVKAAKTAETGSEVGAALAETINAQNTTREIQTTIQDTKTPRPEQPAKAVQAEIVSGAPIPGTAIITHGEAAAGASKQKLFKSPLLDPERNHYPIFVDKATETVDDLLPQTTHQEIITKGQAIVDDKEAFDKLLAKDPSIEPYTPEEIYALKSEKNNALVEIVQTMKNVDELTTAQVNELLDAAKVGVTASVTERTSARMAGQALESEKITGNVTWRTFREQLLAKERQTLIGEALNKMTPAEREVFEASRAELNGGESAGRKLLKDIGNMSDEDVVKAGWLNKAAQEGTMKKVQRSISFAMQGAMLGFKSVYKAAISNPVSLGVNMVDLAVATGSRVVQNTDTYRSFFGLPLISEFEKTASHYRLKVQADALHSALLKSIAAFGRPDLNLYSASKTSFGQKGFSVLEQMGISADDSLALKTWGQLMGTVGQRGVFFKLLGKADDFFGGIAYDMNKAVGLHDEIMSLPVGKRPTTEVQYKELFYSKIGDPSLKNHRASMDTAEHLMLAAPIPEGSNNPFTKLLKFVEGNPALSTYIPFLRPTYNTARFAIEHSMLGIFQAGPNGIPQIAQVLKTGTQVEKDAALAKIMVGTTITGSLAYMASSGQTTGSASANYRYTEALKDSGKEPLPNSIHGVSVDGIDSIRPFVALGSVLGHAQTYLDKKSYGDLSIQVGAALANMFSSDQLMENIADLADLTEAIFTGNVKTSDEARKFIVNFAGRFAPSALKEGSTAYNDYTHGDYYARRLKTIGEGLSWVDKLVGDIGNKFAQTIPPLSRDLSMTTNIFGEPQLLPEGFGQDAVPGVPIGAFSGMVENRGKESLVMERLRFLGHLSQEHPEYDPTRQPLGIEMPRDIISIDESLGGTPGVKVELTPAQKYEYMQYFGNRLPGTKKGATLREQMEVILGDNSPYWKALKEAQGNPAFAEQRYRAIVDEVRKPLEIAKQRAQVGMLRNREFLDTYNKKVSIFTQGVPKSSNTSVKQSTMLGQ